MRVFVEGCRSDRVANEQKHMASLLRKFQVDWSEVNVIGGFNDPPTKTTMDDFQQLVSPFRDGGGAQRGFVSDEELQSLRLKTNRYLRTSELLQQHSRDSDLVVVTMPIPRRSATPAALYLSWLEMLSRNLPPTMLVRGNGTSVLSYFD
ncbi:unnamed protein product [Heligmosomoides polygyrus]|uniref:SLC12A transporter C-terminal domain-containing protein n=1 Tax=Heligmosomoides polygyrus TaxID=6339 RepID=A0A3P8AMG6_HELPZ|nr:unnamed protein product [Heligmosomoides polygyrus]